MVFTVGRCAINQVVGIIGGCRLGVKWGGRGQRRTGEVRDSWVAVADGTSVFRGKGQSRAPKSVGIETH